MSLRSKLLNASDEIRKKVKVPFQVRKDRKSLESWLIDIESEIAELEYEIEQAKGAEDFNPDEILDKVDEMALKQRRFEQGNTLLKELFVDEVDELDTSED